MDTPAGAEQRQDAALAIAERHLAAAPPASQDGAPDPGTSAAGQPDVTTPPAAAPAAPDQALETPFSLADVPEGIREHVERYNKQIQGAFTTKTQELSMLRTAIEREAQLLSRARGEDPKDRIAALNELLDEFDIEIPDDDEEDVIPPAAEVTTPPDPGTPESPVAQLPPELQQRLDYLEQRERAREAQEGTDAEQRVRAEIASLVERTFESQAKARDLEKAEDLPQHIRDGILSRALALPKTPDGLPDMAGAVAAYEAAEAAIVQAYVQKKGGAPPAPDASGTSGQRQYDLSDDKQRLQAAEAVAGRHL